MNHAYALYIFFPVLVSVTQFSGTSTQDFISHTDSEHIDSTSLPDKADIKTKEMEQTELIEFAQSLKGIRYKYASSNPKKGFDCSGFVQYVFNHFKVAVPRSSVDFTSIGKSVDLKSAKPSDLILFTGTDSKRRVVGHVGIITHARTSDSIVFIHASSGKAYSVTETTLNPHYRKRFMKVVRVLD